MVFNNSAQTDWKAWFEAHGARLLLYARQQTRCEADAEDVLQEAFVRVWKSQDEPSLPHLFASIRRAAIDLGRSLDRRSSREARVAADVPTTFFETAVEDGERAAAIQEALHRLPAPQQEVLVLKIWGGLTFDEIATTLEASPNTVASRYRYALSALRGHLNPSLL